MFGSCQASNCASAHQVSVNAPVCKLGGTGAGEGEAGEGGGCLSSLMKIEGDPLNTQHAQHRPKPRFDVSLARDIPIYSSAAAFIHVTLPALSRMGRTLEEYEQNAS